MASAGDISNKCFLNRRFLQSTQRLTDRYPNGNFTEKLKESLETIIEVAENIGKYKIYKSRSYIDYFTEATGVILKKGNPFCIIYFSHSLNIGVIFLLIKECNSCGYTQGLIRGSRELKESHIVCAFDLFDFSRNESLYRIINKHQYYKP